MTAATLTAAFAFAAVLWVNAAQAQVRVIRSGEDRLTGINEVDLLVTLKGPGTAGCNVDVKPVQTSAVSVLRAAGLKVTTSDKARSWHYSIVVDVWTDGREAMCASAVTTELVAEVVGVPEADKAAPPGRWGSMLIGFMPLARENGLVIGAAVTHDAAVRQQVFAQLSTLAARIRLVNP